MPIMLAMWQAVQRIEIMYQANFPGIQSGVLCRCRRFQLETINYIILIVLLGVFTVFIDRDSEYLTEDQQQSSNQAKQTDEVHGNLYDGHHRFILFEHAFSHVFILDRNIPDRYCPLRLHPL